MVFLAVYIGGIVLFHQLLFYGQKRGQSLAVVGAVNYTVAALFKTVTLILAGAAGSVTFESMAVAGGVVNGILYVTHFFVLIESYRLAGVGISAALAGAGVIVPVAAAWLVWSEPMTLYRWLAVSLIPFALELMRPRSTKIAVISLKGNLLLVSCFLIAGIVGTVHKAMTVYIQPGSQETYQSVLFITTAVVSLSVMAGRRLRFNRQAVRLGGMVGLCNALVLVFLMLGLASVPAVIFFPTGSAAIIILNLAMAMVLWHERPTFRQLGGILAALAIIILANISMA